jgi:hypothetical protein
LVKGPLNKIPGVEIRVDAITRRPTIPLAVLTDDAALKAFLGVLDWYIAEVKAVWVWGDPLLTSRRGPPYD